MFGKFTVLKHLAKNWLMNRPAERLIIVSTNLEGFSFTNHGQFA